MKPTVSFVLVNRDGGPFDAAWRAIEAQSLPANQLDVHVLSPVDGKVPPVPVPTGETVIFLGAPMIPAPDLATVAHSRLREVATPDRSVLQGRIAPYEDVRDAVSRRVIDGQWCDFERVTDPENLPFYWLDPRCLAVTNALFAKIGSVLVTHAFSSRTSRAALGRELTQTYGLSLRVRPRLRGFDTAATTIDAALERTRIESAARYAFAAADTALAATFGIPAREELLADDPATHRRRVERLSAIARELAKLDLPHLLGSQPPDLPVVAPIERLTDDVLRRATGSVARMSWIVAARQQETEREPESQHEPEHRREPKPEHQREPEHRPEPPQVRVQTQAPSTAPSPPRPEPKPHTTEAPATAAAPRPPQDEEIPSLELTPGDRVSTEREPVAPERDPEVSILIVARDAAATLPESFAAIDAQTDVAYEVIVVDNGSTDDTAALAKQHPSVTMVLPLTEPVGYGEAANLAARVARGRHIVLLEPDAVPGPGWIGALTAAAAVGVGAVGPVSNGLPGAQSLVRWLERFTVLDDVDALVQTLRASAAERAHPTPETRWLQPLCILMPREVLTAIGPFDSRLDTADAVTLELALRLTRRNLSLRVVTDAFVARAGGLRRPLTASSTNASARADLQALRDLVADGPQVPTSRSLWGVSWAGEIGTQAGPRLSVVIPVCNQLDFTKACLDSLRSGTRNDVEIVVVDNGSTDGTAEYLAARGDVVVVRNDENLGFAPAVNQGLRRASGREILVLNNDIIVPARMVERLLDTLDANPSFDMIGPVTNCAAPSQQVPASYQDIEDLDAFSDARWRAHGTELRPEPVVLGFAMLMRREVLDSVGGFDERFEVGNFEDNDFSLRATVAGYRLGVAEGVYLHHFGGKTFVGEGFDYAALMRTNHARFVEKWQRERSAAKAPATATDAPAPPRAPAPTISGTAMTENEEPSIARLESPAPGWFPLDASKETDMSETPDQGARASGPRGETPANGRWSEPTAPDTARATGTPGNGHAAAEQASGGHAGDDVPEETPPQLAPGDIYLVANDRLEKGLYDEAEQLFAWTIEEMPEMVLAHMGRGLALARLGRLEEAASALERTVRLEPTLSEGYNNLGVVYYMMGRLDQAQRALRRGMDLDPENDEARDNLNEILARMAAAEGARA